MACSHLPLLLFGVISSFTIARSADPTVTLPNGMKLIGSDSDSIFIYRGIPYSQPPVDDLRWQSPKEYIPTDEDVLSGRSAKEFGSICVQPLGPTPIEPEYIGEEDCLFANVYVPVTISSEPLPVAVWIHGGSYVNGAGSLYNGTALSTLRHDTIVVTINYRMNIFGFLGSKELAETAEDGGTGNFGILDQRLALKWTRENIAAFGGDSSHISIFGESAGAGSVSSHLLMPDSTQYFDAAVMESGGFSLWNSQPLSIAQSTFDSVLDITSCDSVDCLKTLTKDQLTKACSDATTVIFDDQAPLFTPSGWAPTVDGVELTDHPWNLLVKGLVNFNDVPVIIGTNRDEGAMFTQVLTNGTTEDLIEYWNSGPWLDSEIAEMTQIYLVEFKDSYPEVEDHSVAWWASIRSLGDLSFTCATQHATPYITSTSPTFVYHFEHVDSANIAVSHGAEVPYVFHDIERILGADDEDKRTCDAVAGMWLDFFDEYNPNPGVWEAGTENVLMIESSEEMTTADDTFKKRECDFWFDVMARLVDDYF
ncbi:hypothetical protein TL16_g08331 [Triparma laevis f. inornata]|uniref:Carboxylic ester hydrolase n=1 Tax=Triparma laevis f. inornata TaxID=1714386 RepID=A0A9W7B4V8_9STRA|nr:hypothetical protein TL16_g08331 [Triparma laevis f. inornata]